VTAQDDYGDVVFDNMLSQVKKLPSSKTTIWLTAMLEQGERINVRQMEGKRRYDEQQRKEAVDAAKKNRREQRKMAGEEAHAASILSILLKPEEDVQP